MLTECRHIKPNGRKCQAAALSGMPYCYFHARLHRMAHARRAAPADPLELPVLEDRAAVLLALTQVVEAMASSRLEPRRAGQFLYALQIAAQLVEPREFISSRDYVQTLTFTPDGDELGPEKRVCKCPDDCEDCSEQKDCEEYQDYLADEDGAENGAEEN